MKKSLLAALVGLLAWSGTARADTALQTYASTLRAKAKVLKQYPGELRWQQIPWETDLGTALKAAQDEKRPLFLWTTGDDPLGRC